jgi:hypothetical protein
MKIAIFNPEHDLCLANGRAHYVPPQSAVDFARQGASLMQILYPEAHCTSVYDSLQFSLPSFQSVELLPWGWNLTLKSQLLRQGVPEHIMPSDSTLSDWRALQHRSSWLPLQPHSHAVTTAGEVEALLAHNPDLVMKAPWSGSGRGLRWVRGRLSDHDRTWLDKVVGGQQCVIVEPRWEIRYDYALEYRIDGTGLTFVGFSLFDTAHGVYRGNRLLPDEAIACRVGFSPTLRTSVERWLLEHVAPRYHGPLGVDCICDCEGHHHVAEINLRHTMGMVAHAYLCAHPEAEGSIFTPSEIR